MSYTVYFLSNHHRTTLYIGVTNNLGRRIQEHKSGKGSDFCHKYQLTDLVYFEVTEIAYDAIVREKQLKAWKKDWKWNLVRKQNPNLKCLLNDLDLQF